MDRPNWRQCGRFPGFTDAETKLLDTIAGSFGDHEQHFRRQLAAARVVSRENTIVGFYTHVETDRSRCAAIADYSGGDDGWINAAGGHAEVNGVKHGMGFILWFKRGYLDCIEGFTYGEADEMPPELADLRVQNVQIT